MSSPFPRWSPWMRIFMNQLWFRPFMFLPRSRGSKLKLRTIFDGKVSGLSAASGNTERVLLPRPVDVVEDVLNMQAFRCRPRL
eukprot:2422452-Amphidinium_carterae.1